MTIFDRYIVRQFLLAFFFGLLAFILIFIAIDMMDKLDDFIDAHAPVGTIIEYYGAFSPEIIKLMTPVAMLLGSLFVVGRLSNQNELAAMKSSGVSLYRVLAPFLVVATIVSCFSVYFSGWIVPYANQRKYAIERTHLNRSQGSFTRYNILFQAGRTRLISMNYYDSHSQLADRVSIQDFADTNLTVMRQRYDAMQMRWVSQPLKGQDSGGAGWVLVKGTKREFFGQQQELTWFDRLPVGRLNVTPSDIEKKQRRPDEMDYPELKQFVRNQRQAGQDVARWMVDLDSKIAFPFASVIVVLFGVPFASIKRRSGIALEFGICTAVTFIYLAFMKISQVFGYNGDLSPLLTAWIANLIFLALGVANLLRVQK
jgi:lipopolysaccharide export system permease protein